MFPFWLFLFFRSTFATPPDYLISTYAGVVEASGYAGDGGKASSASMSPVYDLWQNSEGETYISNARTGLYYVRKVDVNDIISTFAGNGGTTNVENVRATSCGINDASGIFGLTTGVVFIISGNNNRLKMVATNGIMTTVAGTGTSGSSGNNGPASSAELCGPYVVRADTIGNLYFSEQSTCHRIRIIDTNGIVRTLVGTGASGSSGVGGPATSASLTPAGFIVDHQGSLIIGDDTNNYIKKITYPDGIISIVGGTGSRGAYDSDGVSTSSVIGEPRFVWVDTSGSIFISEVPYYRVRVIDDGLVYTIAGDASDDGFGGDGGYAVNAKFRYPSGIFGNTLGNLYVGDVTNTNVRLLTNLAPTVYPSMLPSIVPTTTLTSEPSLSPIVTPTVEPSSHSMVPVVESSSGNSKDDSIGIIVGVVVGGVVLLGTVALYLCNLFKKSKVSIGDASAPTAFVGDTNNRTSGQTTIVYVGDANERQGIKMV